MTRSGENAIRFCKLENVILCVLWRPKRGVIRAWMPGLVFWNADQNLFPEQQDLAGSQRVTKPFRQSARSLLL